MKRYMMRVHGRPGSFPPIPVLASGPEVDEVNVVETIQIGEIDNIDARATVEEEVFSRRSVKNTVDDDASPYRDDPAHGKPDRPSHERVYGEPNMPHPVAAPCPSPAQGDPAGPCLERAYGEPEVSGPSPSQHPSHPVQTLPLAGLWVFPLQVQVL